MEQLVPELLRDLTSRERKLAVCASPGNLAPADRAEILVLLSTDADEVVAQQALEALRSQPVEAFVEALNAIVNTGRFRGVDHLVVAGAGTPQF